jgi:hypothetical protein
VADEDLERPSFGFVPKLIVGALAVVGLITIIGWVTDFVFGLTKTVLVVGILVLAFLWLRARFSRRKPAPAD